MSSHEHGGGHGGGEMRPLVATLADIPTKFIEDSEGAVPPVDKVIGSILTIIIPNSQ